MKNLIPRLNKNESRAINQLINRVPILNNGTLLKLLSTGERQIQGDEKK